MRLIPLWFAYSMPQINPKRQESPFNPTSLGIDPHSGDSFQRFCGKTDEQASFEKKYTKLLKTYEKEQNPHYLNVLNWAAWKPAKERKKLLNEQGAGLTDFAIAALLKMASLSRQSDSRKAELAHAAFIESSPSYFDSTSVSPSETPLSPDTVEETIVVRMPTASSSCQNTLKRQYSNYQDFDESNPKQRALPEKELDVLKREDKINAAIDEGKNGLVYTVGTSGENGYFHRNRILAYRWKLSTKDLAHKI